MQEITREQEAAIARLAMLHGSVHVETKNGAVYAESSGRRYIISEAGGAERLTADSAYVRLPVGLLRSLLGEDRMSEAFEEARPANYPDHRLGQVLGDDVRAAIEALLAVRA